MKYQATYKLFAKDVIRVCELTVITNVTEERVEGLRHGKPFDVKRKGMRFSIGSGSGKKRFNLKEV